MRITTKSLCVGDVMSSGEIVTSVNKMGHFQNVKMAVTLHNPKTGIKRNAIWAYHGDVFIRSRGEKKND